ncbi:MAG: type II toxin-antitoxin system PemK/MazF family toxin [Desulfamplus sp.]|nr:type II toxin-antitoxin system PemK/MazF family toxin [Desulfamplus sp.]
MKEGDVILAQLPQANGKMKNRPAVFLREMPPPYRDMLVCGVSTQLQQYVINFDDIISPPDADFDSSGLQSKSVIRLGFLAVIPRNRVLGSIGSISSKRHKSLLKKLCDYFNIHSS